MSVEQLEKEMQVIGLAHVQTLEERGFTIFRLSVSCFVFALLPIVAYSKHHEF